MSPDYSDSDFKKVIQNISSLPNAAERTLNTRESRREKLRFELREKQKNDVEKSKKIKRKGGNMALKGTLSKDTTRNKIQALKTGREKLQFRDEVTSTQYGKTACIIC
jgi:hypothetical protein